MEKLFQGGNTFKEIRHKLTIEHRVIYNGDLIISPKTQKIGDKNCT